MIPVTNERAAAELLSEFCGSLFFCRSMLSERQCLFIFLVETVFPATRGFRCGSVPPWRQQLPVSEHCNKKRTIPQFPPGSSRQWPVSAFHSAALQPLPPFPSGFSQTASGAPVFLPAAAVRTVPPLPALYLPDCRPFLHFLHLPAVLRQSS